MNKETSRLFGRSRTLGTRLLIKALILAIGFGLAVTSRVVRAEDFETPPILKASEVLSDEMQRGESFVVQEQVRNDGFMNHYVVDSDLAPIVVRGSLIAAHRAAVGRRRRNGPGAAATILEDAIRRFGEK